MLTRKSSFVTDNTLTTQQVGGSANPFQSGKLLTNTDLPDTLFPAQRTSEYEWCIKPTQYILANTIYYFRTPVGDYPVVLPSLTTGSSSLIKKPLFSNGSFEQDLNGWTNLVRPVIIFYSASIPSAYPISVFVIYQKSVSVCSECATKIVYIISGFI